MNFDEFVSQGWQDHAEDAAGVFARLPEGVGMVAEVAHLPGLAGLVVHVAGEHLGRWDDGIALLDRLEALPVFDAATPQGKAVLRGKAVLHRCAGDSEAESRCAARAASGEWPAASDRIRILAVAASAFLGRKQVARARADFDECVRLASYGPVRSDPAARALAVTGNNLACELENLPSRTDEETALMLRAAVVARDFWRIAGGWMEEERAEYRLAMSHVKAGDAKGALAHAQECLRIVEANGGDPGEAFFAREAIARARLAGHDAAGAAAERAAMESLLPQIADEGFRAFAAGELAKLG